MDGGTTWLIRGMKQAGIAYISSSFTSNFQGALNISGMTNYRIRATTALTGTAVVRIVSSVNSDSITVTNPILLKDSTTQSITNTIKAASTAAVATDTAIVVAISPNNTIAATQSGTWNINNVSGVVSLPTGAATEATLVKLPLAQGSTTSGQSGTLTLGAVTTALPTYTTAQSSPLSLTTSGYLRVDLPPGASTSSNQTNGSQKTQIVDSSGNVINSNNYGSAYGLRTSILDSSQTDNLQRLRVSEANTILSLCFDSSAQTLLTNTAVTGSSTITLNTTLSAMQLTNTTSSSDSAILQSKEYIRYNPGRSYLIMNSGTLGAKKTNVVQRFGYFDASDGMFFEQTGTDFAVVIRSSTSGSVVNNRIVQASWNLDKLDGTGPSGFTLDTTKHNLYIIDFLWLGAGRVRYGVDVGGKVVYCHEYIGGNVNTSPFTRTASLPTRAEITNTGTAASSTTLNVVCFSAQRESVGNPYATVAFSQSRGITALATTATIKPLISIRPKLTFNSITNRTPVVPQDIQIMAGSQNTFIQVFLNATLTGPSWTSADALSVVEYDITATAISGGTALSEFYIPASTSLLSSSSSALQSQLQELILSLNVSGSTQDTLTVAATSLAGGTNTFGSISWEEFQ
jgi:hypothetical protein